MSGKRNQRQRTRVFFTELRTPWPGRPSTCDRPPTTRLRRRREASGRINLSVATGRKERGQASKTEGLPPSTWWASPALVAGGVSSACLLPSAPLQSSASASPKTRGRGDGERGRGPRGRRGGEHQLYGNEGHLQRFPSPGFSFCSRAHHLSPTQQPQVPARVLSLRWGREELSRLQNWLKPLESQGEGLRPGTPGSPPHRGRCRVELDAHGLI